MPGIIYSFRDVKAKDRKVWRKWLEQNHDKAPGIWLVYYKKDSGKPTVKYGEAVEEALCFGWIDSTTKTIDEISYKQLFMPRKAKSVWSKPNKERVQRMIEQGQMTEAGLVKIEAAKKDGSWAKLDDVDNMVIPPDLKIALADNKIARKHFDAFSNTQKKYVLYWLTQTKTPAKRAQIIEEVVAAAADNLPHPRFRDIRKT